MQLVRMFEKKFKEKIMRNKLNQSVLLLLAFIVCGVSFAKPVAVDLKPEPYQKETSRWLVRLLEQLHYKPIKLDDDFSQKILDNYIEILDPNKVYFYAQDIAEFNKYKLDVDDAIKSGDVELAFKIFTLYVQRIQERTEYAVKLLEKGFDFTVDEDYIWNREDEDRITNEKDMDELWRKRVKNDYLNLKLAGKEDDDIKETLKKRYEQIDKRVSDSNNEDVFQIFMNSYANLIEPHTSYLAPRTSENFKINMSLTLQGIGALLGIKDEHVTIMKIIKGGPAEKQGELKSGDRIVAVGQGESGSFIDVVGWRTDDVVEKIRGEKGTVVRLSVIGEDESLDAKPHIIAIVRDKVKLEEQAAQYQILEVDSDAQNHKIGVINLPAFYLDFDAKADGEDDFRSTTKDVKKILSKLEKENVEALIMDLRDNGGGSLTEARDLTGLFIEQGPVVQIKNSRGNISVDRDMDKSVVWDKPVIVLINRASASASEIFTAALQDYGRAIVVGERSFGKGTVQSLIPLQNYASSSNEHPMGQLKLTLSQFFRINGGSTQNRGVIPDIQFPDRAGTDSYGESEYENALPWTSIKRSNYDMSGDLTQIIPVLRKQYEQREELNPEFTFIKEDYDYYNELKEDITVSLSESKRKQENDEQEDKKKQRKQQREEILKGSLDPAITLVKVLYNSEDDVKGETIDLSDEETESENNSEPDGDFILKEAARIISDMLELEKSKLIAENSQKPSELGSNN